MRKNENSFSIWNRVGVAVLAAQIMGHDAMFTLLGVYSFSIFLNIYKRVHSERIEQFIEAHAFLWAYDLAPPLPPSV